MRSEGKGSLSLFNIQSGIDKELNLLGAHRIYEKLGMAKPEAKIVQSFEMPLIPKQEDFFLFPFRHLSATTVGGGTYKATDFSKEGVLKKAYSLLRGKPAYMNHIQLIGQGIGTIGDTEWVPQYKNSKGDLVPGGIEGPFVIDGILHPELVRQLSAPVSPIDSCSVTVAFEWEASHEFEHDSDFFWHLGEIIKDGDGHDEMVRRIVTKILAFEESSLVWMGADPFAKMLNDKGEVINIDRAAAYAKNKFSADRNNAKWDPAAKYFVVDCLDKDFLLHLSKSIIDLEKPKPEKTHHMNEELLLFLAAGFGITVEDLKAGKFEKTKFEKFKIVPTESFAKMKTSEDFEKEVTAKTKVEGELATTKTELTKVQGEKVALETQLTASKALADIGTAQLKAAKDECKRIYGIFAKGKEDKTIADEIEAETSIVKLDAKIKMFGGSAISEFGGKCGECGSSNINFRSSAQTDPNDPGKKNKAAETPSLADGFRR
jgi:hypothetical protein